MNELVFEIVEAMNYGYSSDPRIDKRKDLIMHYDYTMDQVINMDDKMVDLIVLNLIN